MMRHEIMEAESLLLCWNEACFIGLIIQSNVNKTPDWFAFHFDLPFSVGEIHFQNI